MAKTKRFDPPSVVASGHRQFEVVANADADREYCWANPNDPEFGLEACLAMGWEQEFHRKEGPRSAFMRPGPEGTPVTQRGYVLVSMPSEQHRSEIAAGPEARTAATEKAIIRRRTGVEDPMRGIHRGISFKNETTSEFAERGL